MNENCYIFILNRMFTKHQIERIHSEHMSSTALTFSTHPQSVKRVHVVDQQHIVYRSSFVLMMATTQNTLHVSEYSPDGKLLAFINAEGKLKIWDTETSELKQEFVPKLHLSVPFTCFTWITIDNAAIKEVCRLVNQPNHKNRRCVRL